MEKPKELILIMNSLNRYVTGGIFTLVVLMFMGFHTYNYYQIKNLKEENYLLKLQTQNLAIFTEDKGRIVKLEELLYLRPNAKESLNTSLPFVAQKILTLANRYKDDGVTVPLLLGIIEVESNFKYDVISKAPDGVTPVAYGLMQIVRSTATPIMEKMGYTWSQQQILQPEINLEVGTTCLVNLHRQFMSMGIEKKDEWTMTILAYNQGERIVLEAYNPRIKGSVKLDYVAKVKMASKFWTNNGF